MTQRELDEVVEKHKKWLRGEVEGKKAEFREANLLGANLLGVDLRGADLREVNLREADLREADLRVADLRGANLLGVNLREANLRGADLLGVNLRGADLLEANLRGADLLEANLREANLREANLLGVNLREADLREARLPHFQIPQEGSLIGWKKVLCLEGGAALLKIKVPETSRRTASLIGRKCRAEFVEILSVEDKDGHPYEGVCISTHDSDFEYPSEGLVTPDSYDDDIRVECTNGIHFFLTREEALKW